MQSRRKSLNFSCSLFSASFLVTYRDIFEDEWLFPRLPFFIFSFDFARTFPVPLTLFFFPPPILLILVCVFTLLWYLKSGGRLSFSSQATKNRSNSEKKHKTKERKSKKFNNQILVWVWPGSFQCMAIAENKFEPRIIHFCFNSFREKKMATHWKSGLFFRFIFFSVFFRIRLRRAEIRTHTQKHALYHHLQRERRAFFSFCA